MWRLKRSRELRQRGYAGAVARVTTVIHCPPPHVGCRVYVTTCMQEGVTIAMRDLAYPLTQAALFV